MLRIFCLGAALLLAVAPPPPPAAASPADPRLLKALDGWLKAWRRGKLPLVGPEADRNQGLDAVSVKLKVLPKGFVGRLTARRELEVLVEEVVKLQTPDAAAAVLDVAAAGFDDAPYTPAMAPGLVRSVGEKGLAGFAASEAAVAYVLDVARGAVRPPGTKERREAMRAAALRALGTLAPEPARATLEAHLADGDARLRLSAVEGLWRLTDAASAEALAEVAWREHDELVLESAVSALQAILAQHGDAVPAPARQRAVEGAITALGRCGWRTDMVLVGFLERFRSAAAIAPLIEILQRFLDHPDDVRSGRLSGLLRHRAHQTLISLSGALFPIDRPDQWREFWERERDGFTVAKAPAAEAKGDAHTVSAGFFGVPVQGTRVVFIVDLSGSMNVAMALDASTAEIPDRLPTRLDKAKAELTRAVAEMPEIAGFNLVSFDGSPSAKSWSKDVVPATDANKKKFFKFVEDLTADGGTNTWAGLQLALDPEAVPYGERAEAHADEVFLLSDGMPSVGDVVDANEILRLVAETNRFTAIRINTVYIADQLSERDRAAIEQSGMQGEEFLRLLAEQNGGVAIEL